VFVGIGNGTFNGTTDYGDSFVKLDPNTLKVIDYFTPSNQAILYLINRSPMGKFCASCDDSQAIGIVDTGFGIFDAPAFAFGRVYLGGVGTQLKAWQILDGRMSASPVANTLTIFGYPGTSPAISSDGNIHPIVWALDNSGFGTGKPAVLHAYNSYSLALQQRGGVGRARYRGACGQVHRADGGQWQSLRHHADQTRRLWAAAVTP
jgi:hypothetical protein